MDSTTVALHLPCDIASCRLSVAAPRGVRLVAYGGYDKSAHVYAFGESSRRAKLDGHTTAVTCVSFDNSATRLMGGSDSGSLRLWDLHNEECVRTFGNGHKASVTSTDYHLFGEFVASCSRDAILRIWDIRKKSGLQSYKDAGCELTVVRFCPSGRWIATGGVDGVIRLYDLTKGVKMTDLATHSGPIESLAFHDEQFYLAAGSKDGTVSLWGLDQLNLIYQSAPTRTVSAVYTTQRTLFAASPNTLKAYNYDALQNNTSTIEGPWSSLADLTYDPTTDSILGVDFTRTTSNSYVIKYNLSQKQQQKDDQGLPSQRAALEARPSSNRLVDLRRPPAPAAQPPLPQRNAIPMLPETGIVGAPPPLRSAAAAPATPLAVDLVEKMSRSSAAMTSLLQRRLTHVKVLRTQWPRNAASALKTLALIAADTENDAGVVVDFLQSMQNQRMKESLSLEVLPGLLECIRNCVENQRAEHSLVAALKVARTANTRFRSKIDEALRGQQFLGNGVDISMEARIEKARATQSLFDDLYRLASQYVSRGDEVGEEARHLLAELPRPPAKR